MLFVSFDKHQLLLISHISPESDIDIALCRCQHPADEISIPIILIDLFVIYATSARETFKISFVWDFIKNFVMKIVS